MGLTNDFGLLNLGDQLLILFLESLDLLAFYEKFSL